MVRAWPNHPRLASRAGSQSDAYPCSSVCICGSTILRPLRMNRHDRIDVTAGTLLVVLCALWGLTQVAIKLPGMEGLPPMLQAGLRSTGAALLLCGWTFLRGGPAGLRRLFQPDGAFWLGMLIAAMFAGEFLCIYPGHAADHRLTRYAVRVHGAVLGGYRRAFPGARRAPGRAPGRGSGLRLHRRRLRGGGRAVAGRRQSRRRRADRARRRTVGNDHRHHQGQPQDAGDPAVQAATVSVGRLHPVLLRCRRAAGRIPPGTTRLPPPGHGLAIRPWWWRSSATSPGSG